MNNIHDIRLQYKKLLLAHGIPSSSLCVDILLAYVLGYSSIHEVQLNAYTSISEEKFLLFTHCIDRVLAYEPIAYIIGKKYFLDFEFIVSKETLIPRPETEELVLLACNHGITEGSTILDIGTGSGCIACSLQLYNNNLCNIVALDISYHALCIAQENAIQYNLSNISFIQGDLYTLPFQPAQFTHIIANPPYLSEEEFESLEYSVAFFEPYHALVSGSKGYEASCAIIEQGYELLQQDGWLFLEIGTYQRAYLLEYAQHFPWASIEYRLDLSNKERFILLQK